jgi:hypothetical protein
MIQIHYGCTEKNCTTPTCYSCHKRLKNIPVRRPTILTARTLAFQLAGEEDPYVGLCPNRLLVSPETVYTGEDSAPGSLKHDRVDKRVKEVRADATNPKTSFANGVPSPKIPVFRDDDELPALAYIREKKRITTQKDRRSLTQNLFDTRAVKAFEWKLMDSPVDILRGLSAQPVKFTKPQNVDIKTYETGDGEKQKQSNGHAIVPKASYHTTKGKENAKASTKAFTNDIPHDNLVTEKHEKRYQSIFQASQEHSPFITRPITTRKTLDQPTTSPQKLPVMSSLSHGDLLELRGMAWESMMRGRSTDAVTQFYDAPAQYHLATTHKTYLDKLLSAGSVHPLRTNGDMMSLIKLSLIHHFGDPSRLVLCLRSNDNVETVVEDDSDDGRSPCQRFVDRILQQPPISPGALNFDLECFTLWKPTVGPLIFNCLWHSLGTLFTPPPDIACAKSPRLKPQKASKEPEAKYLNDADAAHIILVAIFALVGSVETTKWDTLEDISNLRAWGRTLANSKQSGPPDDYTNPWLKVSDDLEYEPAVRLASRLVRAIAARRSFWLISRVAQVSGFTPSEDKFPLMEMVTGALVSEEKKVRKTTGRTSLTFVFVEWLRTIMLKNWDGKTEVKRWDHFGAALEILSDLCGYSLPHSYPNSFVF